MTTPDTMSPKNGGLYRREKGIVGDNSDDAVADDNHVALNGNQDGPRKKVKLTSRPMCTNCEQCKLSS